jgi:signal transduction histidine kinase
VRRFLEIIDKESDRLSRLISDLLDLAKIERNAMSWRVDTGDLREVVVNAAASLGSLRDAKKIQLEMTIDGHYPMRADLDRIQQVITNLLGNAIKFTPEGGAIELSLARRKTSGPNRAAEGRYAVVRVADNGPGIPPGEQQAIFSKFYQSVRNRSAGSGTGLGLAISREIVLHHKGEIWVESHEGHGSTFYFTMPLIEEPDSAQVQSEAASGEGRS